jgi:glycosyltransferase involved in cell wall biosynthesis
MRVAVTTVQVPFIKGGGELHASGLTEALKNQGVEVELVSIPFRYSPAQEVIKTMDTWAAQDFDSLSCGRVDRVICLKFPTYYLEHPRKVVWLMHQHRAVYELFDTEYGESSDSPASVHLRGEVLRRDTAALSRVRVFANSRRVAERLASFNKLPSVPLYHPPRCSESFFAGDQLPYIFAPSRIESLKRHELLLRAMPLIDSSVMAVFVGEGGIRTQLERLATDLQLENRVRFLGHVSFNDLLQLYANSLGVYFGPFDEDMGYVTLEAMLSSKPVITCRDSGGPLEFVIHDETGFVVDPAPEAIAASVNRLAADRSLARRLGQAGRARYMDMDISWTRVVDALLG